MQASDALGRGVRLSVAHLRGRTVPFHVGLTVTSRCNLRCVYCSHPLRREPELTAADWCRVLGELRALGTERVAFAGGEPLGRPDLLEIVARARELDLHCTLTSNGTFVPQRRDVLSLLHTLVISLDGDRQAHDTNRGVGSHAEAIRAIQIARSWNVPVKLNAVLNTNSVSDVEWLLEFSRREGLPLSFNVMRSETALSHDAADHRAESDRLRAVLSRIIEAKRDHPQVVFSKRSYELTRQWPDFGRDRLTRADVADRYDGPRCSAGRFHCVIHSDGRLFPCVLTVDQVPALNVMEVGVARALERAAQHGCATCVSTCMSEMNGLFAFDPRVIASLARSYLSSRIM